MFKAIFWHELKYWLKSPSLYVYALVFLLMAAGTMAGTSGIFGADSSGFKGMANAPLQLYAFVVLFHNLLLFLLPTILGHAIYRDYASKIYTILFTYPFRKADYLAGKFLGAFAVLLLISACIGIGLFAGTQLPGTDPALIGPTNLVTYLHLYSIYLIPNMLFTGLLVFGVVLFSRNIYAGFITVVLVLICREVLSRLAGSPESSYAPALLLDPFAETATHFYTRYLSQAEQSQLPIPLGAAVLCNRLFWLTGSALLGRLIYQYFTFDQHASSWTLFKKPTVTGEQQQPEALKMPIVVVHFTTLRQFQMAWKLALADLRFIWTSGAFLSMLIAGCVFVFILLLQINSPYETRILPVTWVMLKFPVLFFSLLIQCMTFLYAGVLIQRPKSAGIQELIDVSPVSNWALLLSKILALVGMQILLLLLPMMAGISVQVYQGDVNIEPEHYIFDLFGIHLIRFVLWAFAALWVQTLFTHPYVGLFVLIIGALGIEQLPQLGIESLVFRFNQDYFFSHYSDLSGYGYALLPYYAYKIYWLLFGLVLFGCSLLFWRRGGALSFRERMSLARKRCKGRLAVALLTASALFGGMGCWLYHLERTLPHVLTEKEADQITTLADQQYGHYAGAIQPRIVAVKVNMHIFPESLCFLSDGVYTLINPSGRPIDSLLISTAQSVHTSYRFDRTTDLLYQDVRAHFDIHRLQKRLLPGDTMHVYFEVKNIPNNLLYKNAAVERNGTFITSTIYPAVGYYRPYLNENPPARNNHYRSIDADYIDFEAIVSTSSDQTALAPGYLQHQWQQQGRQYFYYKSTTPVTNDFFFTSGRYEILKDKWKDISLEIYYHKGHEHNLAYQMQGLKATLDYCEQYFSPYQHKQIRIIEYSRLQGDFGQSFANTIPLSEIGFIMDNNDSRPGSLNLAFLGAAHELAHQWWGHQVIPADVPGLRMITESMAEYVSLQVMKRRYGTDKAHLFLKKASDIYRQKRAADTDVEKPLMYNPGLRKKHIAYQKGVLALHTMSHLIGEERLNAALRTYLNKVKNQTAPYTISAEMVDHIRQATPDSLQYLIRDLFETVTCYQHDLLSTQTTALPDGTYQVDISFTISKYRINDRGEKIYTNEADPVSHDKDQTSSLPLADYIEIGMFSNIRKPLYLKQHKVTQVHNTLRMIVSEMPASVVIDPNLLLIL